MANASVPGGNGNRSTSDSPGILFVADKPVDRIPSDVTHVLNLTPVTLNDARLVRLDDRYQAALAEHRKKYITFIHSFAEKSGLMQRPLEGSSLWWFSEIQHKDSWGDRFFHELVLIKAIEALACDLGISRIHLHSDSRFLRSHFEHKIVRSGWATRSFLQRTALLVRLAWLKIAVRAPRPAKGIQYLFFSFFPANWNQNQGKLSDRFYRRVPELLGNSGYLLWESGLAPRPPGQVPAIALHQWLSWRALLGGYFDFCDLFWYWRQSGRLRTLSKYEGIDLWPVYSRYLHESVMYNGFFYRMLVQGMRCALEYYRPSHLVATGEFGPVAMATTVACAGTNTWSVWYQHSLMATGKLWFLADAEDVGPIASIPHDRKAWLGPGYHPLADRLFVWSSATVNFLKQHAQYPVDRCEIVESGKTGNVSSGRKMGQSISQRTVLFAPTVDQAEVHEFCRFIEAVCEHRLRSPEEIVLKLHPAVRERFDVGHMLSTPWMSRIRVVADGSGINSLVQEACCLVAGGTTLGVEAANLGLRVVQYVPMHAMNWSPLDRSTATCFSTVEELLDVLRHPETISPVRHEEFFALDDPEYGEFIRAMQRIPARHTHADQAGP